MQANEEEVWNVLVLTIHLGMGQFQNADWSYIGILEMSDKPAGALTWSEFWGTWGYMALSEFCS